MRNDNIENIAPEEAELEEVDQVSIEELENGEDEENSH